MAPELMISSSAPDHRPNSTDNRTGYRIFRRTRPRAADLHLLQQPGRPSRQNDDAVGHGHRFLYRMRHHHDGVQSRFSALPDADKFLVENLAREFVKRAKRLVEQKQIGIAD